MEFKRITKNEFNIFYKEIESAFPYEERRSIKKEKTLLELNEFNFCKLVIEDKIVGVCAFWEFKEFVYLEHIAIKKELRGRGYGSEFLREFRSFSNKIVFLEVEHPISDYAKKRINFYQNGNFVLNDKKDYIQPSYHNGEGVPLLLMSSKKLNDVQTEKYVNLIRRVCYGINE